MIHLNDKYAIAADDKQFTLVEKVVRRRERDGEKDGATWKAGDEYAAISPLGHHMTVSGALSALYRRRQREVVQGTDTTLQETINAFRELQNEIKNYEVICLAEMEAHQ